jgi:predicted RNA binding protein YcfA (HicA-like mRNA interferase family)
MSGRLPRVSHREVRKVLARVGYAEVRQKGSHLRLRHPEPQQRKPVTVPLQDVIKPGLLHRILRDAGLTADEFSSLLREV